MTICSMSTKQLRSHVNLYEYWSFSSQNIPNQLLMREMELNTGLTSHISGKQTYSYLYHRNIHVLGTTWHIPRLQMLKVVKH